MRRPPGRRSKSAEFAQALPNFGGQVVAGREPHAHAGEPRWIGIAVDQPGKHGGHADNGGDAESLDQVERVVRRRNDRESSRECRPSGRKAQC